ncbi:MAG: hypothetical protein IPI60_00775 [Saprospiraceae bacterium]|jgi:hypothetical protein|nr:hypothetical protein [Saprospiraceae bacterium]
MNLKRIFGGILTVLGIVGLIYCAVIFSQSGANNQSYKSLLVFGIIGLLFFFAGISLVRTTKDEA